MQQYVSVEEWENQRKNRITKINDAFARINGLKPELKRVTKNGRFACAYDRKFEQLCVIAWNELTNDIDISLFACEKLKSIEIGTVNYTKSVQVSSTKLGSALVGGVLLGGGGALIGAMLGKQGGAQEKTLTKYQFKITSSDQNTSDIAYDLRYSDDIEEVTEWVKVLRNLLNNRKLTTPDTKVKSAALSMKKPSSLADEILKLSKLHIDGILSAEEYQAAKSKLLK